MASNFMVNLTVIVVCYITVGGCDAFSFISFTKDTICDTQSRLVQKCMAKKEGVYRTQTDCAYQCLQDHECVGVSTDTGSACFHHFTCPGNFHCGVGKDMPVYWRESAALPAAMTISTAGSGATSILASLTTTAVSTAAGPVTTMITTTNEIPATTAEATLPPTTTTTATTPVPTTTTATTPVPTTATTPVPTTTAATTPAPTTTTTLLTTKKVPKTCKNNGNWSSTEWRCVCNSGWVGDTCEVRAKGCQDIADNGYSRGWPPHWIDIAVAGISSLVRVRCLLRDTYFTLYMMINQGYYSHNKSWRDYEDGYTLDQYQYHYWMGLKTMKKLNDLGHTTVVLETTFNYPPGNNTILQYRYEGFRFDNSSNGYKFTFSQAISNKSGVYSNNVQHSSCLDSLKGVKFSTPDKDNDGDSSKNCALAAGVGWWIRGCDMVCNPLGFSYQAVPSEIDTPRHIKMAGLDYRRGVYANQVAATMYFLVNLT